MDRCCRQSFKGRTVQCSFRKGRGCVGPYGSEGWTLQKMEVDLLDVFQRNRLWIVLGTMLNGCISNDRLYKECGSILPSRALIRESLQWLMLCSAYCQVSRENIFC